MIRIVPGQFSKAIDDRIAATQPQESKSAGANVQIEEVGIKGTISGWAGPTKGTFALVPTDSSSTSALLPVSGKLTIGEGSLIATDANLRQRSPVIHFVDFAPDRVNGQLSGTEVGYAPLAVAAPR